VIGQRIVWRVIQFLESGGAAMRLHTKEELGCYMRHSEGSDMQRK
jgi:hypothetical protein